MELNRIYDVERSNGERETRSDLWTLPEIDLEKSRFPCCLVWTPLPVVSWLAPFIGHVGICREDGTIIDFSGSNFVNVDDFAFGSVARYLVLDREQCCFPPNLSEHTCKQRYKHSEFGTSMTWDGGLQTSSSQFEHRMYNLFTCNCHSFVASFLNRVGYKGSIEWNMVNVAFLVLVKGKWASAFAIIRSFLPSVIVICFGIYAVGWPFLIGLCSFSLLLLGWFLVGTYCIKSLFEC